MNGILVQWCAYLSGSGDHIVKDAFPGLVFDYFFGLFGYSASHTLPGEEGLTPNPGGLDNAGDELDPLTISEGVEIAVELRGLDVLNIVVCHTGSVFEVVLRNSLEKA